MRTLLKALEKVFEIFTSLTRSFQYELLQAIKKGESNLLDSFGKSISSNFNYLDLELQDQILSLQKINSAFIPSINTSMSPTDCSTSVQDNNNHYPVLCCMILYFQIHLANIYQ